MTRHRSRHFAIIALAATAALTSVAVPRAGAVTRTTAIAQAANYAAAQGYYAGFAVLDTSTGRSYVAGHAGSSFISASVIKVLIASRLLLGGDMHGSTATVAYRMVTQSDNDAADELYPLAGGDTLVPWLAHHYRISDLGTPPNPAGDWGLTGLVPLGLVELYAKLKADPRVAPWLLGALHHTHEYSAAGEYEWWGLPSASPHAAAKQGWNIWAGAANVNTTGYVDGDRYAVAILSRGPVRSYLGPISRMLTHAARLLLPGGYFPDALPAVTSLSRTEVPAAGGRRLVVQGSTFTHVTQVLFGGAAGRDVVVTSPGRLVVTEPAHAAGWVSVRIVTTHGTSPAVHADHLQFVSAPAITAVQPGQGPSIGGALITVTGTSFRHVTKVLVGGLPATSLAVPGPTTLTVRTPAHPAGSVDVQVVTEFGASALGAGDTYDYS